MSRVKFCGYCDNLLVKKLAHGSLKLQCQNCKNTDTVPTETDKILFEFRKAAKKETEETLLRNIANDPVSLSLNSKCPRCGREKRKLYISDDYEKTRMVCPCEFEKEEEEEDNRRSRELQQQHTSSSLPPEKKEKPKNQKKKK